MSKKFLFVFKKGLCTKWEEKKRLIAQLKEGGGDELAFQ